MRKRIRKSGLAAIVALVVALVVLSAAPAFAHHKADHEQGGQASEQSSNAQGGQSAKKDNDGDAGNTEGQTTEDTDTDDYPEANGTPNNQVDDDDNAHPSGNDRSVEHDKGNQGNAESDPDDDGRGPDRTNGGFDKPGGPGGVDRADQDGNNGCGNDDDFEDDNEGLCLGRNKDQPTPPQTGPVVIPCDADATMPGTQPCGQQPGPGPKPCDANPNMPGTQPCDVDLDDDRVKPKDIVLNKRIARPDVLVRPAATRASKVLGAALPFTGGSIAFWLVSAVALLLSGLTLARARRS